MKNNVKKLHKRRGMTLVEVIISIAVMAVLALLLTTVGVTIDNYRKNTKSLNAKVTVEAPVAEGKKKADSSVTTLDEEIVIKVEGVEVKGKLYGTGTKQYDKDGNFLGYDNSSKGNLKFVDDLEVTTTGG